VRSCNGASTKSSAENLSNSPLIGELRGGTALLSAQPLEKVLTRMCARRLSVSLTEGAQQDYDDILLYGLRTWGAERALRYQDVIDEAMLTLAEYPEFGLRRDDLFAGCRQRPVEHHVIYNCIEANQIVIVNILHERADTARHLLR
jgi:toxin ParE1/3/4